MEFCDKCGGLLVPQKSYLVCRRCGKKKKSKIKKKEFKLGTTTPKGNKEIVVVSKKERFEALPKTTQQCPKCEHREAYWWMQQTRAGDEAPTRFFKCCECGHVWREYE